MVTPLMHCIERCRVLDPFAGGSVRGFVSALQQHEYYGVDVRQEQAIAPSIVALVIV